MSVEIHPEASDIPSSLREHDQWICWRSEYRDGKQTKVPVDPSTGGYGSSTDAGTWTDFSTACAYATSSDIGVGFVFTDDDPFVGVDLDDCRVPETGTVLEWAESIVERLDSYTEVSPSGSGLHVIVAGALPDGRNRSGDVELYETARFFTVTGAHVDGTPTDIRARPTAIADVHEEYVAPDTDTTDATARSSDRPSKDGGRGNDVPDEVLLDRARNASNGEKFARLWRGETSGYESHSEADMALCSLLAFWTGGDASRIDRLFRRSGLYREKWDEVHYSDGSTYGEKTIVRAVDGTDEYYTPPEEMDDHCDSEGEDTAEAVAALERELAALTDREAERLERVEELQSMLRELERENAELREELESERLARRAAERRLAELESQSLWERIPTSWP